MESLRTRIPCGKEGKVVLRSEAGGKFDTGRDYDGTLGNKLRFDFDLLLPVSSTLGAMLTVVSRSVSS
jgi:hypothetical protein